MEGNNNRTMFPMETFLSFILLLWLPLPVAMGGSCWNYQVERCNSYVKPYITPTAIKYYTRERLQMFCDAKPEYDACTDHILPYCEETTKLTLQGARDSNDYLCSPAGFDLMIQYSDCYRKEVVQRSAMQCDKTLRVRLQSASRTEVKCRLAEEYLICVENAISEICGHEAGDFVFEANVKVLHPIYQSIGCTLGDARAESHNFAYHVAGSQGNANRSRALLAWLPGTLMMVMAAIFKFGFQF